MEEMAAIVAFPLPSSCSLCLHGHQTQFATMLETGASLIINLKPLFHCRVVALATLGAGLQSPRGVYLPLLPDLPWAPRHLKHSAYLPPAASSACTMRSCTTKEVSHRWCSSTRDLYSNNADENYCKACLGCQYGDHIIFSMRAQGHLLSFCQWHHFECYTSTTRFFRWYIDLRGKALFRNGNQGSKQKLFA